MASNITYSAYGTRTTVLSTELNSLASGSRALATTAYDNTTNHDLYADFELLVTFGTGPTTGSIDLYLLPSTDGTNYADGSNSVVPALANLAGSFVPQNSVAQQRLSLPGRTIPPGKFQLLVVNNGTSQAFAASGNALTLTPYHLQSA